MAPLVARVRAHAASLEDDLRREIDGAKDERTLVRLLREKSLTPAQTCKMLSMLAEQANYTRF